MKIKKIASVTASMALVASMGLATVALAESENSKGQGGENRNNLSLGLNRENNERINLNQGFRPVVVGKVSSINGNIITVVGRQNQYSTSSITTYTVNATGATIVYKKNATSTLSNILVGDMIMVQGTANGTNVTATIIHNNTPQNDGRENEGNKGEGWDKGKNSTSTMPEFVGNGQPVVGGKIVTINGNTLTILTTTNLSYTIDATNAKVLKGKDVITLSGVKVGDTVVVQGAINGSTVTASTIIDRNNADAINKTDKPGNKRFGGLFGGIGRFFMGMFGF